MSASAAPAAVRHEPARRRFAVRLGHDTAVLEYQLREGTINLYHTEVPPAFRGRGIAEQLCTAAFAYAQANGLTVIPSCPYVAGTYLQRHPEYARRTQQP